MTVGEQFRAITNSGLLTQICLRQTKPATFKATWTGRRLSFALANQQPCAQVDPGQLRQGVRRAKLSTERFQLIGL